MGVSNLGYLVLRVKDPDRWNELLEDIFGLEPVRRSLLGAVDYRMDSHHHRFSLYPGEEDRVIALGWEVDSIGQLEALAQELKDQGIEVTPGDAELCAERKVKRLFRYKDPYILTDSEIYYGPLVSNTPFAPRQGMSGFKTGNQGLGHIGFWVKDIESAQKFYLSSMGFNISDYIAWDDNDAVFMHCNRRHHTLAIIAEAPGRPAGLLMHFMIEANSLDDVGYAYDRIRDAGIPVMLEPGKHSNDHMQSFYIETPSKFWMEFGYGGREIDGDWEICNYDAPMLWGHRPGPQ